MQSETLTQVYIETTQKVMEAMAKVAADPKADIDKRLKAAAVVDGMGETIVKSNVMDGVMRQTEGTQKKMLKKLDELTDKKED